ncbi:hypothetical protein SDJN02_06958, partial [Cucurbita argyrosperma subsp. argyrosperma]
MEHNLSNMDSCIGSTDERGREDTRGHSQQQGSCSLATSCSNNKLRRASSPCELRRLENPQSNSRMSIVPSRLLSKRSKIRGARGISEDIFIAFSTSSNSGRVALSPFAHLLIASHDQFMFFSIGPSDKRRKGDSITYPERRMYKITPRDHISLLE